ncbi:beta strand repeat-containing protein [Hoeflea prorocentri]|uniref:MBG domain-containing protein n=1 Tax=Hoeflea prorocentri TaxID=1922333 RepID=A0A9X3UEU7_9HYPH|nr:MBG domain-containing protein [Hoeflea prorocentri]MCY6379420.1 MBG domain-containing protein [Hoeflea prorocentri]MDA5397221.1 MBG domain-containing protein [Hoeflea prorocentri]
MQGRPAGAGDVPENPVVTVGDVAISRQANELTITQSSRRGIIEWGSFSIGSGVEVSFDNGSGATLNRVTGSSISAIRGRLTATGDLFLINRNGLVVGANGVIETGGRFVASTLDIDNPDFLDAGDNTFAGDGDASVVNLGRIGSLGGDVALIAHTVVNAGAISAPGGTVGLVAGREVLMRDAALDNGLFSVKLGDADSSVSEQGMIAAAAAELRANGGNVYALAGNTGGTISASGVSSSGGRIFLTAGKGGTVRVTKTVKATRGNNGGSVFLNADIVSIAGLLDASGDAGYGGSIDIGADDTISLAGARLDASGVFSGGAVRVGGELRGGHDIVEDEIDNAQRVLVDAGTVIDTSASGGEGGLAILWSEAETIFAGSIVGGGGKGGFAEVSSRGHLAFTGTVDTGGGMLLLDPENIEIGDSSTYAGYSLITPAGLTAALASNDVVVSTANNSGGEGHIVVTSGVVYASAYDLTLLAHGDITLLNSIQNFYDPNPAGDGLTFIDGGDVNLIAGWDGASGFAATGGMETGMFNWGSFDMSITGAAFGNSYDGGPSFGSVVIGGGVQTVGVTAGSRSGATNVYGYDVSLRANTGGNYRSAQIGYRIRNAFATHYVTGDVSVSAVNDITATGGPGSQYNFAQIGHVGSDTWVNNTAKKRVEATVHQADVTVVAGNDLSLTGGRVFSYAQIGNGGYAARGNHSGNVAVTVGGDLSLSGGLAHTSFTQIGHGGRRSIGNHAGTIMVDVGGNLSLAGGRPQAPAQIGHGGYQASGDRSGDITVDVDGDLSLRGGAYADTYTQIGHGDVALSSAGDRSGAIAVTALGEASIEDGLGSNAKARIGHVSALGTISGAALWLEAAALDADSFATVGSGGSGTIASGLLPTMLAGGDATILLTDSGATFDGVHAINSGNLLVVRAANDLTFSSGSSLSNTGGGDIVLAAGQNFHNDGGSMTPISTTGGRWLVYSTRPDSNNNDTQITNYDFAAFGANFNAAYPSPASYTGSGLIYSVSPSLTILANDQSFAYGGSYDASSWSVAATIGGIPVPDASDYETLVTFAGGVTVGDTLSSGAYSADGFVNVGTYANALAVNGVASLSGVSGWSLATQTGTLAVNQAPIAVALSDRSKTYDGAVYGAGFGPSYSGWVGTDTAALVSGAPSYSYTGGDGSGLNAGVYTVTANGVTENSGNYSFDYSDTATLTINPAPITVALDDQSKTYDGSTYSGAVSYSGWIGADTAGLITGGPNYGYSGGDGSGANVGTYTVTASGATESSGNYSFDYSDTALLVINPARIAVALGDQSKSYDGSGYSGAVSYSGWIGADTAGLITGGPGYSYAGGDSSGVNAGNYTVTAGGITESSGNYSFDYSDTATLTINPATIAVTLADQSKTYDGTVYNGDFGVSFSGWVGSDTSGLITNGPSYSVSGGDGSGVNAGVYTVTVSGATESSGNYSFDFSDTAFLAVNPAAIAVTLADQSKTYDASGYSGAVSYSGWIGSDTQALVTDAPSFSYAGGDGSGVNAGTYTVTAGGVAESSGNYSFDYSDTAALMVDQAMLSVTADDRSANYDGFAYDEGFSVSYSGFIGEEDESVLSGALIYSGSAVGAIDQGSYTISASGQTSGNYSIAYTDGTLTINSFVTDPGPVQSSDIGRVLRTVSCADVAGGGSGPGAAAGGCGGQAVGIADFQLRGFVDDL